MELCKNPEYLEQWESVSADQRDGNSWSFQATTNGRYVVSCLNSEYRPYEETIYTDGPKACAAFIIKLIEYFKELERKKAQYTIKDLKQSLTSFWVYLKGLMK